MGISYSSKKNNNLKISRIIKVIADYEKDIEGLLYINENIRVKKHLYKISNTMAKSEKRFEFPKLPTYMYEYEVNILLKYLLYLSNKKKLKDKYFYSIYIDLLRNYHFSYEETISSVLYNLYYQYPIRYDNKIPSNCIFDNICFLNIANNMDIIEKSFDRNNLHELKYPVISKLPENITEKHIQIIINKLRKIMIKCKYKKFYTYYIKSFSLSVITNLF